MGTRTERFLDRLPTAAVVLDQGRAEDHVAAVQAFLERASNIIVLAGLVGEANPLADLAALVEPDERAPGRAAEQAWMRCRSVPHATAQVLAHGLHWEHLAERSDRWASVPAPYEPVLELIELGGSFTVSGPVLRLTTGDRPMLRVDEHVVTRRATVA